MMKRILVLLYGVIVYTIFFVTFLYLIGFVGNILVPKSIDGALEVPLWQALLTNLGLITLFGVQHSIMARQWFKKWWLKYIPKPIERATYVLFTVFALVTLFAFWQPMGGTVWSIENGFFAGMTWALFALGWTIVLVSTYLINHFDLFGLRQVWLYFRGKPYTELKFGLPFLYKFMRHPLYFGFLIALWASPEMSITKLVFALGLTIYIFMAIGWEENDLVRHFGEKYRQYKAAVPMIFPISFGKKNREPVYKTISKGN